MSKDMDLVVSIGGIADPSLGKAFETVKARLDSLQERSRQASSLRDVLGDAIRLERGSPICARSGTAALLSMPGSLANARSN